MKRKNVNKTVKETLDWLNETYDTSENVVKQILDDGIKFRFTIGDYTLTYETYDDFLEDWEDDIGIPCWTCGHELFRFRHSDSDYLHCFGLGKWLGEV